ncbi:MAG TPA: hypothetical protein VNV43_07660, partial [Candidatus Acidoferrales bacterium]|nr:hypothetical protein [Candidatus Acidoferrales bacterium]
VSAAAGNFIMSGTNNSGSGGTYQVLASTNLLLPLTNWTVLTTNSFTSTGNFSFTNGISGTNGGKFYILRVP